MVGFTIISAVVDDGSTELVGVSDLETVTIDGQDYLFVAAEADGAVSSFRISASGVPQLVDTLSLSATSGTFSVGHIDLVDVDGVLTLLASARHDDDVVPYLIDGQGRIDVAVRSPQVALI